MKQRILATSLLWILVIILPWLLGNWGGFLLIAVFGMGALLELLFLLDRARQPVDRTIAIPAFAVLLLSLVFVPPWLLPPFALIVLLFTGAVAACLFKAGIGSFSATVMPTLGAVALLMLPFGAATLMIHESGLILPIWVLAVTKFGDVGALLTGMWLGRHKLAPALSPRKTWEGLGGGILFSVLVSIGFVLFGGQWLPDGLTPIHAAWAAIFISLAGVVGDLAESAFKREAGVKDSGAIIPGIGGFLDLTDSLTLAFPVAYFLTWLIF